MAQRRQRVARRTTRRAGSRAGRLLAAGARSHRVAAGPPRDDAGAMGRADKAACRGRPGRTRRARPRGARAAIGSRVTAATACACRPTKRRSARFRCRSLLPRLSTGVTPIATRSPCWQPCARAASPPSSMPWPDRHGSSSPRRMHGGETAMGGEVGPGVDASLTATLAPQAPGAELHLLKDGVVVERSTRGTIAVAHAAHAPPAVYRVEGLWPGAPGTPPVPWVVGNPIRVGFPPPRRQHAVAAGGPLGAAGPDGGLAGRAAPGLGDAPRPHGPHAHQHRAYAVVAAGWRCARRTVRRHRRASAEELFSRRRPAVVHQPQRRADAHLGPAPSVGKRRAMAAIGCGVAVATGCQRCACGN